MGYPKITNFHGIFHLFWVTPICGNPHILKGWSAKSLIETILTWQPPHAMQQHGVATLRPQKSQDLQLARARRSNGHRWRFFGAWALKGPQIISSGRGWFLTRLEEIRNNGLNFQISYMVSWFVNWPRFMVEISIVNGVYTPTFNWGAPACTRIQSFCALHDCWGWIGLLLLYASCQS